MSRASRNIIFIAVILGVLILSQQPYFERLGRDWYKKIEGWSVGLWQKIKDYWDRNVLHKVSSEIEKRQQIAKQEIKKETKEATQNIWQKIKNYITGFFSGIFNQTSKSPE